MRSNVMASLLLALALSGCGGGGDGSSGSGLPDIAPAIDMVGRWEGQYGSPLPLRGITLEVLTQTAAGDFTGSWANTLGTFGSLTGSIRGEQVVFQARYQTATCTGSFVGNGMLDLSGASPKMDFDFSGTDCGTAFPTVLGSVTRQ